AAPPALASGQPPAPPVDTSVPATRVVTVSSDDGCRDRQYSPLSRFWELEKDSSCGTLGFRGYRPLSVGLGFAAQPPAIPTSPAPDRTGSFMPYQSTEMRIGLSLRTKLAQGILTGDSDNMDGLWFAYLQFSTWQVFNEELSRPFRTTDHEPELIYSYPLNLDLGGGWKLRYTGLGLNHESNGQGNPYSRSWNRVYLMGGAEMGDKYVITGKIWQRIAENAADDDNPDISDYYGRAEVRAGWQVDRNNQLFVQVRNNLRASAHGSILLEWLKVIGDPARSNLRFQTQLFYGYGDTMADYNNKRTILTVGLALVDF
ncbi:MAG TPA: phospholipase A, partial [Variovorax sp.]